MGETIHAPGGRREIHHPHSQQHAVARHLGVVLPGRAARGIRRLPGAGRRARRPRRADPDRGARRRLDCQAGDGRRDRRGHLGRTLRRGEGAPRGLLPRRRAIRGAGGRDRREVPGGIPRPDRGSADHEPQRRRGVNREPTVDQLLRELAPAVLGSVVRRSGDFEAAEDAVQEALIAAATQWPKNGIPANPKGWLVTVATRRRIEEWRAADARRRREEAASRSADAIEPETVGASDRDDSLLLLMLCCHPALTPAFQIALTLRAVGGLTSAETSRAVRVPESTIAQRISRGKARIRETGATFELPPPAERPARVAAVLNVLYLVFNEGYTASSGESLTRVDLTAEAIRLTRQLHVALPRDGEVAGLLALMLLTDARRPARLTADGSLVPLADQDRKLGGHGSVGEALTLVARSLAPAPIGPYQVQAAIAAVHAEAQAPTTPTGARSSCSTTSSPASRRARWSR